MSIHLITYTLHSPGQKYPQLHNYIKQHSWAEVGTSSYAIESNQSAGEISTALGGILDKNDFYYVFTIYNNPPGYGLKDVNAWLKDRLP